MGNEVSVWAAEKPFSNEDWKISLIGVVMVPLLLCLHKSPLRDIVFEFSVKKSSAPRGESARNTLVEYIHIILENIRDPAKLGSAKPQTFPAKASCPTVPSHVVRVAILRSEAQFAQPRKIRVLGGACAQTMYAARTFAFFILGTVRDT